MIETPALLVSTAIVLGLCIGSFLNVVIYRLPGMMQREWKEQCCSLLSTDGSLLDAKNDSNEQETFNLAHPNSRCPKCGHEIKPWENIPVISYLLLRGKCSSCSTKISARYPTIELITGLLSGYIAYQYGMTWDTGLLLAFTYALISLTMIDFDHQLLPDNITLPLLWLGLAANCFGIFTDLNSAVWGAIAGYLSLWSIYWLFKLVTGKEGMGYGDFKLLAALGAWMGWQKLALIIVLSSFVGAVVGIAMIIILGRDKNIPIPFGPYLAAAGFIAFLWGDQLTQNYLQLFRF